MWLLVLGGAGLKMGVLGPLEMEERAGGWGVPGSDWVFAGPGCVKFRGPDQSARVENDWLPEDGAQLNIVFGTEAEAMVFLVGLEVGLAWLAGRRPQSPSVN